MGLFTPTENQRWSSRWCWLRHVSLMASCPYAHPPHWASPSATCGATVDRRSGCDQGTAAPSHWAQISPGLPTEGSVWLCTKLTKSSLFLCWIVFVLVFFSKLSLKRANIQEFVVKETRVLLPEIRSVPSSSNVKIWYHELWWWSFYHTPSVLSHSLP